MRSLTNTLFLKCFFFNHKFGILISFPFHKCMTLLSQKIAEFSHKCMSLILKIHSWVFSQNIPPLPLFFFSLPTITLVDFSLPIKSPMSRYKDVMLVSVLPGNVIPELFTPWLLFWLSVPFLFQLKRCCSVHPADRWSLTSCAPGGVFFPQDSFTLQHSAAVCEWLFLIAVLLFYATFVMEFRSMSAHTLVVLIQRGQQQGVPQNECKQERA